ncbi:type III secretion system chaperone [Desulfospira joergensenii]|uniref:type III secretion system chaperone n=1 Tax=Desulfospira joergensenii TaxID=53329 RepID=UPI001378E3D9|nr:type III secretion system chaperone [Desulfospira joergensenii]
MEKERLSQMLETFGNLVGITGIGLDEDNACTISFDGQVVLNLQFEEENHTLLMFSNLGRIEKDRQLELFSEMLEAGFYERARGGPSLGFIRETQTAMLIAQADTRQLDFQAFEALVEQYVNCAEAWIARIGSLSDDSVSKEQGLDKGLDPLFSFDMKA